MVKIMEKPIKMDDLGVPLFLFGCFFCRESAFCECWVGVGVGIGPSQKNVGKQ